MFIFLFLECFFTYNLLLLSTVKTWTWTKSAFGLLASFWPLGLFVVCLLYGFFSIPFIAISDCSRIFPCFFILFFTLGSHFRALQVRGAHEKPFLWWWSLPFEIRLRISSVWQFSLPNHPALRLAPSMRTKPSNNL